MSIKTPTDSEIAPGYEFPCTYDVKAMGLNDPDFVDLVLELIKKHCQGIGKDCVKTKLSSTKKYCSVTVTIQALSMDHLDTIYAELTHHEKVLQRL